MAVNLSPVGNAAQFLTTTGLPLAGGKIYTYQAGTSTPFATYTDVNGLIPNTNPIILNADGRLPSEVWLSAGYSYKFVLKDANDVLIATYDNLYGIIGTIPSITAIPSGLIALWSGSIGSVPSGWYLCDGTNGTPDLRDKFVVGAGSSYTVGATGGTADAIVVSHTHTATSTSTVTDPGHSHTYGGYAAFNAGSAIPAMRSDSGNTYLSTASNTTGISVATNTSVVSTGTSGTNQNLPPYYALAYIMKA